MKCTCGCAGPSQGATNYQVFIKITCFLSWINQPVCLAFLWQKTEKEKWRHLPPLHPAAASPHLSPALCPFSPPLVPAPQSHPLFQNMHSNSAGSAAALPRGLDPPPRTSQAGSVSRVQWDWFRNSVVSHHGHLEIIQGLSIEPKREGRSSLAAGFVVY